MNLQILIMAVVSKTDMSKNTKIFQLCSENVSLMYDRVLRIYSMISKEVGSWLQGHTLELKMVMTLSLILLQVQLLLFDRF